MRRNTANQHVSFNAISTTDGSAVTTGTPTVYYTIDGGTQTTGTGTCTHEGNGTWDYVPAQAETDGVHIAFTFTLSGSVNALVNSYTAAFDPTDSVRLGLSALPNAAAGAAGGLPTDSTGKTSFNDIAATAIVSGGAITTSGGAVSTVSTVSNAVTLPAIPANWITAAGITASALNGKGDWNIGKTGYSLTQAFPANFADMAITVTTGQVTVGTNNDKTGYTASTVSDKTGYSLAADQSAVTVGTVNAFGATAKTEINAEMVDVLFNDIVSELASAPAANAPLADKINFLTMLNRNLGTQTDTQKTLYADDGVTVVSTCTMTPTISLFTKGKFV